MRTIKTQFVQDCAAERARQNHTASLHKNDTHGTPLSEASTHLHTLVHAHAGKAIIALGSLPWRIRRRELSTVNEGDNKVRDHESCFWLLSSCRSLRQEEEEEEKEEEESPDGNRRQKPGVHRHLLPLMSNATTTLTGANSKNYLAGLQLPFVPTVADKCVQSA